MLVFFKKSAVFDRPGLWLAAVHGQNLVVPGDRGARGDGSPASKATSELKRKKLAK